ncbi:MAG: DUF4019 domain-containing protein [Pelovirga sp.]
MLQRRSMIHVSLAIIALVIIIYPYLSNKPDPQRVAVASDAALVFLELLDEGKFERAWRQSATSLRNDIPLEAWLERLEVVRGQVGGLLERRRTDHNYTKEEIEGIPEGEYLSFFYATRFENHDSAGERVTLYHEADDTWRVAGYFIE